MKSWPRRITVAVMLCSGTALLCGAARPQPWERLGPEGGSVVSLGVGPGRGVYLGTADGHVFYSGDGAQTWELRGRVGSRLDAVVTRLVSDPKNGNRLYAAAWHQAANSGGGVFRSDDGGRTWTLLGLRQEAVRALEIASSKPDVLVAGTRTGLFRSDDGGTNWERISPPDDPELRNVDSLAIDPQNPELIFVGTYHLPWKTENGGKSWTPVIAGIIDDSDIMSLRIDATNPARLYMSACSGIYRSENRGADWVKLQGIPYSARRTQAIVQAPADGKTLFAGTTEGLWVTRDGGESWTRTTPKDWVVNSVVLVPGSAEGQERVILGTEGRGIQISDDGGAHFLEANRGFTHVIVDWLVADATQEGRFLMLVERAQGRLLETRDAGRNWVPLALSAVTRGKRITLNADQIESVYATPWGWLLRMVGGRFWLWKDGSGAWTEWNPVIWSASLRAGGKGTARSQVKAEPHELLALSKDAVLMTSGAGLVRCAELGGCEPLRAFRNGGTIGALWASRIFTQVAAVRDGKFGISDDGGHSAVWRDLPVPEELVIWVDVVESEGAQTWFLGTAHGLFVSRGLNGEHGPWTRVQGGLPEASVWRWLWGPKVWVAAERGGGIYVSNDQGTSWERVDGDRERSDVNGVLWAGPGMVLVGSQSEGLLRLRLP